jgi:hypothetical protein
MFTRLGAGINMTWLDAYIKVMKIVELTGLSYDTSPAAE